jgi:DNA-directed RNA polymerase subunit E'/Rpb7
MDELFISTKIKSSVSIDPKDLNNNLNRRIISKIRNDVEGKCIKNGYVKKNSVKLIKRSLGESLTSQFNGNVIFHIEYLVDLCNPLEGAPIICRVLNINKMGILAGIDDIEDSPLNILLAKQHHINNAEFEDLKVDDQINIRVLGKKYEFGDSQIAIIGLLENEFIKQNQILEEDDEEEEDLEQMSNQGTINSLSFENSQSQENEGEDQPEGEDKSQGEDLPEAGSKEDKELEEITLKPGV